MGLPVHTYVVEGFERQVEEEKWARVVVVDLEEMGLGAHFEAAGVRVGVGVG